MNVLPGGIDLPSPGLDPSLDPSDEDISSYLDNPKREARVQQIQDDLRSAQTQLNTIKTSMDDISVLVQPRVDACMRVMGLPTFSDLETKIETSVSRADLQRWQEEKAQIDRNSQMENSIFGIVNICAASIGTVGLVLTFVVPPLGTALMEVAATIDLVDLAMQELVDIVEGYKVMMKCRHAMSLSYPQRIKTWVAYEKMLIMKDWFHSINEMMAVFEKSMTQDEAAKTIQNMQLLSEPLVAKYQGIGRIDAIRALQRLDGDRDSWTQEDPGEGERSTPDRRPRIERIPGVAGHDISGRSHSDDEDQPVEIRVGREE